MQFQRTKIKNIYELKPKINLINPGKILGIDYLVDLINSLKYKNIVIEAYPGVRINEIKQQIISKLKKQIKTFWSEEFALQGSEFRNAIINELTEDRVFGHWTRHEYKEYFTKKITSKAKHKLVYGIGANYLIDKPDMIIYIDLPRWEIQQRYRKKENVFFGGTLEEETTKNFKRGYFIEWRMADKIKKQLINRVNYFVDASTNKFKVINNKQFFNALRQVSQKPFRLVPYFDYGVWGGKWMQEKFGLGSNEFSRWAWGFDGVPEENSLIFNFENDYFEMQANNLVFFEPINLLGERVWNRFGSDFPIRFDFLDTIKGQNLSLQVHPNFQYIRDQFWAPYTQEESYYILDVDTSAKPVVYLGVKKNINKENFINDLKKAQHTNKMNVEKYVNTFKVKKHDHILHPAGVIHSSGAGCMVLEISATPYIFTFKMWDWGRLDLNGKPRPINIEHGANVLDTSFDEKRCEQELVNIFSTIREDDKIKEERTGLHPRQFIETRRITIKGNHSVTLSTHNSVNMLNLVEGESILVSNYDSKENISIHYAETFIIPEICKKFVIKNLSRNKQAIIIQAYIRTNSQ